MESLADLSQSRDLLVNLTLRELRGKYKRSVLGWTWSLVNPIAQVAIFSLVFGVLLKIQIPKGHPSGIHNFPVFLFCGVLPFNFVSNGLNGGMFTLLGNAGLIKKVYFRREILVVSTVMSFVVTFAIELAVLMVFVMALGSFVLPWLPMVALLLVMLTLYTIGLGLLFSVLNVYFRDMQYLVAIGLQLWFYATPIIYPLTPRAGHQDLWRHHPRGGRPRHPHRGHDHPHPGHLHLDQPDGQLRRVLPGRALRPALAAHEHAGLCRPVGRGHAVDRHPCLPPVRAPTGRGAVMDTPAIVVDDVSKMFRLYHDRNQSLKAAVMRGRRARYEEFMALENVSLEVPQGTTFGLIGENGSGKSTLLKCMAHILRPDSGRIRVNGKISALLELGAGFHPELSGKENVYLNGAILGLGSKQIDKVYDDIVEFSGLEKIVDTPVKNYSSGQYVRLGFSVAINVDPDVLLVDEVLAVGDEQFQRRCNEKFAELRAADKTIVVVSHGLAAMRLICDQIAWFEHGHLRLVGDASDVIDHYIAEVQVDRQDEEGLGNRWGSGEAQIDEVEIIGPDGVATDRLHTGEKIIFRLHWRTTEPVDDPVFGLAIHSIEGLLVTGPNSREAGVSMGRMQGHGVLDITVERLMLLPGTYDLTTSLYDHAIVHPFDFRQKVVRFQVDPGTPHESFGGVISLDGQWQAGPEMPSSGSR